MSKTARLPHEAEAGKVRRRRRLQFSEKLSTALYCKAAAVAKIWGAFKILMKRLFSHHHHIVELVKLSAA
jgi:hypothetical protein